MQWLKELQRRNVIRVATAYVVVAWLVIQVVETIFPAFGFSDQAIRIVVIAFFIGLLPALVAAWVFEFTPEGIKRDTDLDRSVNDTRQGSRLLDRVIIVSLVLGISYFAVDKFLLAPERALEREGEIARQARTEAIVGSYEDRSIAVLPFVNMSSDPEQEYFAEGISEEILNLLARIRELRVISRSSAFALKELNLEVAEIAERLGVVNILEGSVRKSGNMVRITAQLIEARTDTHLWSRTYDRELKNLFAIQDDIAADVAKNLQIKLLQPLPSSRVVDPEVYGLTRQASQAQELRAEGVGQRMELLLDRALAIDPNYIPALELKTYADYFLRAEGVIDAAEADKRYEELQARIIALEPHNGFVDSVNAFGFAYEEYNLEKAAILFSSSVDKDPIDPNIMRLAGNFARFIGRMEESARILEYVHSVDPLCFQCLYQLGRTYLYAGEYEKAEKARTRFLATGGAGGQIHYSWIKLLQGDADSAMAILEDIGIDNMQTRQSVGLAAFQLGDIEMAQEALDSLLVDPTPYELELASQLAAWMGKNDLAFDLIDQLTEKTGRKAAKEVFNPFYRSLWSDPRWDEWRASIGMSQERLDAIEFSAGLPH